LASAPASSRGSAISSWQTDFTRSLLRHKPRPVWIKPICIAPNSLNLQKTRRKPCMRRNSLSISLRRLYSTVSCSKGFSWLDFEGTARENLRLCTVRWVRLFSCALSMTKGVVALRGLPFPSEACPAARHGTSAA